MEKLGKVLWGLMLLPLSLLAGNIQTGGTVTVGKPANGNTYIAGGNITVNSPIYGDLVLAGGKVQLHDSLSEDALIAGGSIFINGFTGGDVRVVGGELHLNGVINGDLNVTGGEVFIGSDAIIGGEVLLAGGKITLLGRVQGSVVVASGRFDFKGTIQGDLEARGGNLQLDGRVEGKSKLAAESIRLGTQAYFGGDVHYWTGRHRPVDFSDHLKAGASATFDEQLKLPVTQREWRVLNRRITTGAGVFSLLSNLILGLLLLAFFHPYFEKYAPALRPNLSPALGRGSLLLIGLPLLSGLAMITILGIPLGVIGFGIFAGAVSVAKILPAIWAAYWLKQQRQADWNRGKLLLVAMGMLLALQLVGRISFIGSLLQFVAAAIGLGFVYLTLRGKVMPPNGDGDDDPTPQSTEEHPDLV